MLGVRRPKRLLLLTLALLLLTYLTVPREAEVQTEVQSVFVAQRAVVDRTVELHREQQRRDNIRRPVSNCKASAGADGKGKVDKSKPQSTELSQYMLPPDDLEFNGLVYDPFCANLPPAAENRGNICLATTEYVGLASGGIGTSTRLLARFLRKEGHFVRVIFLDPFIVDNETFMRERNRSIHVDGICMVRHRRDPRIHGPRYQTYSRHLYEWMRLHEPLCDTLVYHEWMGVGFDVARAKHQGEAFSAVTLMPVLHGPHLWALNNQKNLPQSHNDLIADWTERQSVRYGDIVLAPSTFIADYVNDAGWVMPESVYVIPNLPNTASIPSPTLKPNGEDAQVPRMGRLDACPYGTALPFEEIVFFGKTDFFKGIDIFCDAIDKLYEMLPPSQVPARVTFLARVKPVSFDGPTGDVYINSRLVRWPKTVVTILSAESPEAAQQYLRNHRGLAVSPSTMENCPNVVLEMLTACIPFIATAVGGTVELIHPADQAHVLIEPNGYALAKTLAHLLTEGGSRAVLPRPADALMKAPDALASLFELAVKVGQRSDLSLLPTGAELPSPIRVSSALDQHKWLRARSSTAPQVRKHLARTSNCECPLISVIITSFRSGPVLLDAIQSVEEQDYPNVEIIIVDDFSETESQAQLLDEVEQRVSPLKITVLRKPTNTYLGDSRNQGAAKSKGSWILFLDADDMLMPKAISTLLRVGCHTDADIVMTGAVYFRSQSPLQDPERHEMWTVPGGPIAAGALVNVFGGPTFLARRESFDMLHGFSTDRLGAEDWEFHMRAALNENIVVERLTEEVYWYRTGNKNSMSAQMNAYDAMLRATRPLRLAADSDLRSLISVIQGLHLKATRG